jgi:hypothetical protein
MTDMEEVKPHPLLSKLLGHMRFKEMTFDVAMLPMICPPLPWTSQR